MFVLATVVGTPVTEVRSRHPFLELLSGLLPPPLLTPRATKSESFPLPSTSFPFRAPSPFLSSVYTETPVSSSYTATSPGSQERVVSSGCRGVVPGGKGMETYGDKDETALEGHSLSVLGLPYQ